jgi:hypothetical protein
MTIIIRIFILGVFFSASVALAQDSSKSLHRSTRSKPVVYSEVGLGFGQTAYYGDTQANLRQAIGGTSEAGRGSNIMAAFYIVPDSWKRLGLGTRIKGTFGAPVKGEGGFDYIFNYYNLGVSAKYYPFSEQYDNAFYLRGGIGFGQMTTKRFDESQNIYVHQYALGLTQTVSVGYSYPLNSYSLGLEIEYEASQRNGTVNGVGLRNFSSGQLGANLYVSF